MKIVSSYVREQKRYTKNDLKSIFSFDESGVEKFIKNLKAFGVLKSVKNSTDQLEMSDLMDEDSASVPLCQGHCRPEHSCSRLRCAHPDGRFHPPLSGKWHHPDPLHPHRQW